MIGIKRMLTGGDAANEWHTHQWPPRCWRLPPALVVILLQKWFVKGLVDTENNYGLRSAPGRQEDLNKRR